MFKIANLANLSNDDFLPGYIVCVRSAIFSICTVIDLHLFRSTHFSICTFLICTFSNFDLHYIRSGKCADQNQKRSKTVQIEGNHNFSLPITKFWDMSVSILEQNKNIFFDWEAKSHCW